MKNVFRKVLILSVLVTSSIAEEPACLDRHIVATITNGNFAPITGLESANFLVSIDKMPANILSTRALTGGRIILLFDRSKGFNDVFQFEKIAAASFLDAIPNDLSVSVIAYSNTVQVISDFGVPGKESARRIRELQAVPGRNAIAGALQLAIRTLSPRQMGDAIVLMSAPDGGFPQETAQAKQLEGGKMTLSNRGIRVFTLLLQWFIPNRVEDYAGKALYLAISEDTGGMLISPDYTSEKGERAAARLIGGLGSSYDVEIQVPRTKSQKKAKVELKLISAPKGKRLAVTHSTWVLPCDSRTLGTQTH
jgi:hypothetical protein